MSPRARDGRPATQDAAVIPEVLDALLAQGAGPAASKGDREAGAESPVPSGVEDLIARAMAELNREHGPGRHRGGSAAPVLGNGVLHGLIAARRRGPVTSVGPDESGHVDERL